MNPAPSPTGDSDGRFTARERGALAVLLALQLALAIVGSLSKSLVQDEFHTLFHASAADLGTLLSRLRDDNHPPAAFLVVRLAHGLLGDGALALRLPQILFGLLGTVLIARTCARVGAPVWLGAALWAISSTQLEFSTQVRMYALSALCSAGAIHALVRLHQAGTPRARRAAGLALALWVALGLHTHYYWVLYTGVLVVSLLAGAVLSRSARALVVRAVPWAVLALLLILPWYLTTVLGQLGSGLPPGMARSALIDVFEAYIHLLKWNLSLGGPLLRILFILGGALGVCLGALGVREAWREGRKGLALVCGGFGFGTPLCASLLSALWPRVGFNWDYILPSAPALALLVAYSARGSRLAALGGGLVAALCLLLSLLNATSPGTENNAGAVRWIHEQWRPGDAVLCVEFQGPVFDQGLAWRYYAPRIAPEFPEPRPVPVPVTRHFDVDDPASVLGYRRVFLMGKSASSTAILERLRAAYPVERIKRFGYGLAVYVFEPATVPEAGR